MAERGEVHKTKRPDDISLGNTILKDSWKGFGAIGRDSLSSLREVEAKPREDSARHVKGMIET